MPEPLDSGSRSGAALQPQANQIDLAAVVTEGVASARSLNETLSKGLVVSLPASTIFVNPEAGRLAQDLSAVLSNAATFTSMGGDVTVSLNQEGDQAVIRVSYNAAGISAEQLSGVPDVMAVSVASFGGVEREGDAEPGVSRRLIELYRGAVEARSYTAARWRPGAMVRESEERSSFGFPHSCRQRGRYRRLQSRRRSRQRPRVAGAS
ncbi:MAG: ATP-binding protein [Gemmatimonadaceae bacterium]